MISTSAFLIRFSIVISILLLIDFYVFRGVKTATSIIPQYRTKQIIYWLYWIVNIAFMLGMTFMVLSFSRTHGPPPSPPGLFSFLGALFVLLFIPKLVFSLFLLTEDVYRMGRMLLVFVKSFFGDPGADSPVYFVGRRQFISQLGVVIAGIPFLSILYGITKGKYNYTVHRINVAFKDLPDAFHGFTITQLSDIHAGSFDNVEEVKRGINLVNEQKSDLILFTGDLVNNFAQEMEPWVDVFSRLTAKLGKYSITGNHDYSDYVEWETTEKKKENFELLKQMHHRSGFRLLLNENIYLERENSRIALLGIENWGTGGFAKYGDLEKTLHGTSKEDFKILMSHDPSHWDAQVINHDEHIHLTLAGHTHGMQFGVEIPGIKWSPVQYRYPRWAGLYKVAEKHLYVNRGFGFLGFPGRVGIWPEITVITLQKG